MRIPTLDRAAKAAMTLAVATAVATLPGAANAADPVAADDTVQTTREAPVTVNVLANDIVDAGKSLTVTTVTPEALHGDVECTAEGECTYTPEDDWVGTDTFTYGVTDGTATDTGQVTVTTVEIASISLGLTPGSVVWSTAVDATNTVKATGTVRRSSTVFLEGVEVELWYQPFGAAEYSQVPGTSAKTSDENGRVSWGGLEMTSRTPWRCVPPAPSESNIRTVVVTPSLNVSYADKKHALGQSLTVTGSSAPATAGDPVVLERRRRGRYVGDTPDEGSGSRGPDHPLRELRVRCIDARDERLVRLPRGRPRLAQGSAGGDVQRGRRQDVRRQDHQLRPESTPTSG